MADFKNPNSSFNASDDRRSGMVFGVFLSLVFLAVAFPEMAPQGLLGILWTGAGLLMVLIPPTVRIPKLWVGLAGGFVLFSLIGFLPREWFHVSSWRTDLENLGLETGKSAFVLVPLAVEVMVGFAVTAVVAIFLIGHRVSSRTHHNLALAFALGIGAWATVALSLHKSGEIFGFFPNRNHTATLLVMGAFVGLGSLAHAIRTNERWKIGVSIPPVLVCLYALHAVSESRAGVVLVLTGFVLWIAFSGLQQLRGNVGKAVVLILIAVGGVFLIVDSTSKKRLTATVEQLAPVQTDGMATSEDPFSKQEVVQQDRPLDGRLAIYKGTWAMVRHEPWTGVGPGQFAQVFPQYREGIDVPNDSRCLHPESDWLMMLAENGWAATLFLCAGVIAVFVFAVRQTRRGRARFLRMGCIVAALLLCFHGLFDVPGHRIGLTWAGLLLLAMSLRPGLSLRAESVPPPSGFSKICWRISGGVVALAGIYLIHAQWVQRSVLPSAQVVEALADAQVFYKKDQVAYDQAKADGRDYQPPPSDDPLEVALLMIKRASDIAPLEAHPHFISGVLALHYDDKNNVAENAFTIQRRLVPTRVNLPIEQSQAWLLQNPQQVLILWKDALRRAAVEEALSPNSHWGTANTYEKIIQMAGKEGALLKPALKLADGNLRLVVIWAHSAPADLLDQEMPGLLFAPAEVDERKVLFQIWENRGSENSAVTFFRNHPELSLAPR